LRSDPPLAVPACVLCQAQCALPCRLSTCKQGVEAAVNEQINVEYTISYVYHALSTYFDRDNVSLPGLAAYFREQSDEEKGHAQVQRRYRRVGRQAAPERAAPEVLAKGCGEPPRPAPPAAHQCRPWRSAARCAACSALLEESSISCYSPAT
jgi:hypothetical protein